MTSQQPIVLGRYSPSQNGIVIAPSGPALCLAGGVKATEQGYIECDPCGVFDADYPQSELRRARVKDRGRTSGTLMSGPPAFCVFLEYQL